MLANRSTLPQPPRGRNACYGVLREGLRDRKQSVPGTPKAWQAGTPFGDRAVPSWGPCGAVAGEWALQARKSPFWRLWVRTIHHTHRVRCMANLGPWRGCFCGWTCLAAIDGRSVAVLCTVTVTACESGIMATTVRNGCGGSVREIEAWSGVKAMNPSSAIPH